MPRKGHTEEEMVTVLQQVESDAKVADVFQKVGTSEGPAHLDPRAGAFTGKALLSTRGTPHDWRSDKASGDLPVFPAGKLRENALKAGSGEVDPSPRKSYALGLPLCIFSGILSACANLGFAFGTEMVSLATNYGIPQRYASIPFWAVITLPLFFRNQSFCVSPFIRKRSLDKFLLPGTGHNDFLGGSMAAMWLVGRLLYGIGANKPGRTSSSIW